MKSKYCIKRCSTFISVIILASVMPLVHGYEQSITAVFKQNPSNPNENKFVNTTPISGFCLVRPGSCTEPGIFSIRVRIGSLLNSPIQANHSSVREGVMFNVPSAWRKVELTSENGDRQEVEVRISGIGVQMEFAQDVQTLKTPPWTSFADAHNNLWHGGGLEYPPGVCRYTSTVAFTARYSNFFWKTPSVGICPKKARYRIPNIRYDYFDMAYELRTPNPLGMPTGEYRGTISYSVGPGKDFDFGDLMIPDDPMLNMNFALSVQHTLKVEIPPGGNNVELVPQEGWQSWIQKGRRPTRFFRDQTFNISASSPFNIYMECEHQSDDTCAIKSESGDSVPLKVSVTLPLGVGNEIGQPVKYLPLLTYVQPGRQFIPTQYLDRRRGTLHFEVPANNMRQMLLSGAPSKYTGDVTVIWDSDL
ncbi:hypothetical protein [Pseudomonas fluorescens]|uniref:Uncharacterized protein n=2 Tax=Pseudomonas fluorescens TaxID=294 RepID=A0ABY1TCH1_PSEFL|nr:hypothetical protein [Pseudomonas fluorescens]MCI4604627.1 hypothetical protein [Pseudomonas fluorescens]PQB00767.1 hypothetical protein B0A76_10990 [Pseudomonas fluorescens]RMO76649.1 hypothetical protein ALQ35_200052 [Pseudomonas fluorescens]SNY10042.1 hypothetical protein SAMN04488487_3027 [Pseudomonas fluorescens]SQF89539.1 Uncharacterised protein [Pseudomonas fluorescens]